MELGLKEEALDQIIQVFSSSSLVEQVILYGSRAMGNYREGSDVDLTVKGEKLTHKELDGFIQAIDDLNFPWLFDISLFHHIENQDLKGHIQRVGKVIYSQDYI